MNYNTIRPVQGCEALVSQQFYSQLPADDLVGRLVKRGNGEVVKLISVLGMGGCGKVYLGHRYLPNYMCPLECAVKVVDKTGHSYNTVMRLRGEVFYHDLAYKTSHSNIVPIMWHTETRNYIFMILEYVKGGDLTQHLGLYHGNDQLIKSVFLHIVDTVAHLHKLHIYHRDLKLENILVQDAGARVLLADFGLCTPFMYTWSVAGTEQCLPPECFNVYQMIHCPSVDIWSLGLILVQIVCGVDFIWSSPTMKCGIFRDFIASSNWWYDNFPISKDLNKILRLIFVINPQNRITLSELRQKIQNITYFTRPKATIRRSPDLANVWAQIEKRRVRHEPRPKSDLAVRSSVVVDSDTRTCGSLFVDAFIAQKWLDMHSQDDAEPALTSYNSGQSSAASTMRPVTPPRPHPPHIVTECIDKGYKQQVPARHRNRHPWWAKVGNILVR